MKFLIDENVKISDVDRKILKQHNIVNCTDIYREGTPDEILTKRAKDDGWIIITSDIRMTLRSLISDVGVIFIDESTKSISFLTALNHKKSEFTDMYDYLMEKYEYK